MSAVVVVVVVVEVVEVEVVEVVVVGVAVIERTVRQLQRSFGLSWRLIG